MLVGNKPNDRKYKKTRRTSTGKLNKKDEVEEPKEDSTYEEEEEQEEPIQIKKKKKKSTEKSSPKQSLVRNIETVSNQPVEIEQLVLDSPKEKSIRVSKIQASMNLFVERSNERLFSKFYDRFYLMKTEKAVFPAVNQKIVKEMEGISIRKMFPPSVHASQIRPRPDDSNHWIVTQQGTKLGILLLKVKIFSIRFKFFLWILDGPRFYKK